MEMPPPEGRIEVVKASLSRGGLSLDIRFRLREVGNLNRPRSPIEIYVIEESSGERFNVLRVSGVGALGQRRLNQGPILFALIDNSERKIKKDSRVTLVVGKLRQEHIVVEE